MYVYIHSEKEERFTDVHGKEQHVANMWTVGFYDPEGKWVPETDHSSFKTAAERCSYLNGGKDPHQEMVQR